MLFFVLGKPGCGFVVAPNQARALPVDRVQGRRVWTRRNGAFSNAHQDAYPVHEVSSIFCSVIWQANNRKPLNVAGTTGFLGFDR